MDLVRKNESARPENSRSRNLYKYIKRLNDLGRIDEFKYSTVILVLLLHVFGPWETVSRM